MGWRFLGLAAFLPASPRAAAASEACSAVAPGAFDEDVHCIDDGAFLQVQLNTPKPEATQRSAERPSVRAGDDAHAGSRRAAPAGDVGAAAVGAGAGSGGRSRGASGPRLRFMHIPKTGGSSIEEEAFALRNLSAGFLWGRRDAQIPCSPVPKSVNCKLGESDGGGICPRWHIPAAADDHVATYYQDESIESFCVVRHPYRRLFSQWKWVTTAKLTQPLNCSAEDYAAWVRRTLVEAAQHPNAQECHLRPMADFVFDRHGKQTCRHVLKYESLSEEFRALMRQHELPLDLAKAVNVPRGATAACRLDLPSDLRDQVFDFYRRDFLAFGYDL